MSAKPAAAKRGAPVRKSDYYPRHANSFGSTATAVAATAPEVPVLGPHFDALPRALSMVTDGETGNYIVETITARDNYPLVKESDEFRTSMTEMGVAFIAHLRHTINVAPSYGYFITNPTGGYDLVAMERE